jgi:hypothetical protein
MRKQEAQEDERAGEPADDEVHFHKIDVIVFSPEAGREQHAENCAVNGADDRITGQRASAGRTADEFVVAEAESASDENSEDDAQNHGAFHV